MRTVFLGVVGVAFCAGQALAVEAHRVKYPTVGCFDRGLLERAGELRNDDRSGAAGVLLGSALEAGECLRLQPGILVTVEDSDIVAGLTRVRAQDEPRAIWVRHRALDSD